MDEISTTEELTIAEQVSQEQAENAPQPAELGKVADAAPAQPYTFEGCTITVSLVLFPTEDNQPDRLAALSVRSHADLPVQIDTLRLSDLGEHLQNLGSRVEQMLATLRLELPKRAALLKGPKPLITIESSKTKTTTPAQPEEKKSAAQQLGLF